MHIPKGYPSDLTDGQWNEIKEMVPSPKTGGRPPKHTRRVIVNAILYLKKTGCQWRQLPNDYPPDQTVFHSFALWSRLNIWKHIHDRIRERVRCLAGRKPAPTAALLDSQSVKHADQSESIGYDAGKKIKGRKRHLLVDTLGLVLALQVTAASVQDRDGGRTLIEKCWFLFGRLQIIWADSGYQGAWLAWVKNLRPYGKLRVEIVKRSDKPGFQLARKRWIIERTFSWLFKSRRLCRDYERNTTHSEAMIYISMTHLMLRRIAK